MPRSSHSARRLGCVYDRAALAVAAARFAMSVMSVTISSLRSGSGSTSSTVPTVGAAAGGALAAAPADAARNAPPLLLSFLLLSGLSDAGSCWAKVSCGDGVAPASTSAAAAVSASASTAAAAAADVVVAESLTSCRMRRTRARLHSAALTAITRLNGITSSSRGRGSVVTMASGAPLPSTACAAITAVHHSSAAERSAEYCDASEHSNRAWAVSW
jgi:hypothetical protein